MSVNTAPNLQNLGAIEMVCQLCEKSTVLFSDYDFKMLEDSCKNVGFFASPSFIKICGLCACCKEKERLSKKDIIDQNGCTC